MNDITDSDRQHAFTEGMDSFFADLEGTVGVMVRVPDRALDLVYNADTVFPTASTLKVPLLYELYRQSEAGRIDLTRRVTLAHKDRVPGSGVLQMMDEGLQPTIRDLAELMITVSDNYATDLIFDLLGKDAVTDMLHAQGLTQTSLPMTIREMFCAISEVDPNDPAVGYQELLDGRKNAEPAPDNLAYSADPANDVSSPADMVLLLTKIENGEGLTPESRDSVIQILKNQNFSTIIPARLPQDIGIETAHKTGSLRGIRNDVGMVYSPDLSYLVAFMSKDLADTAEAVSRMAHASRWIWDYLTTAEDLA